MTAPSTLVPGIRTYLGDFVVRSRRLALVRAGGMALATFLGWMVMWCIADRFLHLGMGFRLALLAVGVGMAVAWLAPAALAFRRRPDWIMAAAAIERHDSRFGQRLLTVTSRVLGAADYRGSDEILLRLMHDVDGQLAPGGAARLLPIRRRLAPWGAGALLLLLMAGLMQWPNLGFKLLAVRFLDPFAPVPAVTTTRITVMPGDRNVVQSQPLTIRAEVARLGNGPVLLHLSDDGRNWSRVPMSPAGNNAFAFTLASVDRDLRYYLSGGDAQSPRYALHVLRRPAVTRFRIDYQYPAYTRLPPMAITNTDGKIEAPMGTRVLLTVTASEPLQDALLTVGADKVLMDRTGDPRSRQAQVVVRANTGCWLDLISARDVPGSGPRAMGIRALPDSPPKVRLARGGQGIRLTPRSILPLAYDALDDYGIQSLRVRARVNARPPADFPVRLWGDRRRQQDVIRFDLASLPLSIGDVLTLTMDAADTAGQRAHSEPVYVLISPNSTDVNAPERIAELSNAVQLAGELASQLEEGFKAEEQAAAAKDRQSAPALAATSRGDRALTAASQTATLLRQALLRAVVRSSGALLSRALAVWIDAGEVESAAAQDAFRQSGAAAKMPASVRQALAHGAAAARKVAAELAAVERGEQATVLLADQEDLGPTTRPAPASDARPGRQVAEAIVRMRREFKARAAHAGLDPSSAQFGTELRARIAAEQRLLDVAGPVNFATAAEEWARQIQRDPRQRLALESRLAAAAQAEALRSDADLPRARDLELASRATSAIGASARAGGKIAAMAARCTADVRRLVGVGEKPNAAPGAPDPAIGSARLDLLRFAGDLAPGGSGTKPQGVAGSGERQKEAEDLAMQAGAAAAEHQYQQANALDRALQRRLQPHSRRDPARSAAGSPASSPANRDTNRLLSSDRAEHHRQAVTREMKAAEKLDALHRRQQQLAQSTGGTKDAELATGQQTVADQIASLQQQHLDDVSSGPDSANRRDQATAAVLAVQEQLAAMPQALAQAQSAAAGRREAAAQASIAAAQVGQALPDQRQAAARAAAQARQTAADAAGRLSDAMGPVVPAVAESIVHQLQEFTPETEPACAVISDELQPALLLLQQGLEGADSEAVDFAAADVRVAIEDTQRELSAAQDQLVKRDPLMAARWFARAAAQSLTARPPDVGGARRHQADVAAALARAWDQSIHRAAAERLAVLPSLAAVLGPSPPANPSTGAPGQSTRFPAAREWGRLRAQDGPELGPSLRDSDPPGYEQALKLYFEALGRPQQGR